MSWAAAASAADAASRTPPAPAAGAGGADPPSRTATPEPRRGDPPGAAGNERRGADRPEGAGEAHGGNGASVEAETPAKAARRARKAKHQGLPEGWVIDEEGFVVPGAG
jgi:hypothetical protein